MNHRDLIVVWLNNRLTLWQWDEEAEAFCYFRELTDRERQTVENGGESQLLVA
jgi:hypothetical protein